MSARSSLPHPVILSFPPFPLSRLSLRKTIRTRGLFPPTRRSSKEPRNQRPQSQTSALSVSARLCSLPPVKSARSAVGLLSPHPLAVRSPVCLDPWPSTYPLFICGIYSNCNKSDSTTFFTCITDLQPRISFASLPDIKATPDA